MRPFTKINQELQNTKLLFKSLLNHVENKVSNEVFFVSQFANPEYAERILKDRVPKTSDPDWRVSGAESPDEYAKWVTTVCGMACTAMALNFFDKGEYKTITLAKEALQHDVFQEDSGELSSMQYKEYTQWIVDHGLTAEIYTRLTIKGIRYLLSQGHLVIASVNPNIRDYKTADDSQIGGHLVLIIGYDTKEKTLTIHNPSGFVSQDTHKYHTLTVSEFLRYYAWRGIALATR